MTAKGLFVSALQGTAVSAICAGLLIGCSVANAEDTGSQASADSRIFLPAIANGQCSKALGPVFTDACSDVASARCALYQSAAKEMGEAYDHYVCLPNPTPEDARTAAGVLHSGYGKIATWAFLATPLASHNLKLFLGNTDSTYDPAIPATWHHYDANEYSYDEIWPVLRDSSVTASTSAALAQTLSLPLRPEPANPSLLASEAFPRDPSAPALGAAGSSGASPLVRLNEEVRALLRAAPGVVPPAGWYGPMLNFQATGNDGDVFFALGTFGVRVRAFDVTVDAARGQACWKVWSDVVDTYDWHPGLTAGPFWDDWAFFLQKAETEVPASHADCGADGRTKCIEAHYTIDVEKAYQPNDPSPSHVLCTAYPVP